jgi:hypothetical protein
LYNCFSLSHDAAQSSIIAAHKIASTFTGFVRFKLIASSAPDYTQKRREIANVDGRRPMVV